MHYHLRLHSADAIVDLEFVDRNDSDAAEIASRMAICYEALGDNELASQFLSLAAQREL